MTDAARTLAYLGELADAGATADDVRTLIRVADWTKERIYDERRKPGWFSRLRTDATVRAAIKQIGAALRESGGPHAMLKLDYYGLKDRVPKQWTEKLRGWEDEPTNVALLGPTGIGKSLAAVLLLVEHNAATRRACTGHNATFNATATWSASGYYWARAIDLARATAQHPLGRGEPPEVTDARGASVLVLDDLGWERETDSTVRDVLAARYDTGRITIVTSGLTPDQLTTRYGAAFVRRLLECEGRGGIVVSGFPRAEG